MKITNLILIALVSSGAVFASEPQSSYQTQHESFRKLHFSTNESEYLSLAKKGQAPKTLFVGCSDSRVIPELIVMANPGEMFVIRSAGNFIPLCTSDEYGIMGTVEYGVNVLGVQDLIVCGHSTCGAIKALFTGVSDPNLKSLAEWLKNGMEAKEEALKRFPNLPQDQLVEETAKLSIVLQLGKILCYPGIKEKIDAGQLKLHGWYFNIQDGLISSYNPDTEKFESLVKG